MRRVISDVCVCVCVCPCSKWKRIWAVNSKLCRHTVAEHALTVRSKVKVTWVCMSIGLLGFSSWDCCVRVNVLAACVRSSQGRSRSAAWTLRSRDVRSIDRLLPRQTDCFILRIICYCFNSANGLSIKNICLWQLCSASTCANCSLSALFSC